MTSQDKRIQTTFRISEKELVRFKKALAEKRAQMSSVVENLILNWTESVEKGTLSSSEDRISDVERIDKPPEKKALASANPWVRILDALEKKVNRHSYDTWLKPTRFSHSEGVKLFVNVPTPEFQQIGDRYADLIQEAIDRLGLKYQNIEFVPPMGRESSAEVATKLKSNSSALNDWQTLNPRYTFDGFVIGSGNQFAHAASLAVAEAPSKAYNPLFLYGGVGMGKTHLIQAIGHEVKRRNPAASIAYLSSEKFTNELINSLKTDGMVSFRDKLRKVDVLLIDDIQFIAGKERTQEEFFHTFNALHEQMRQIVIASDRPPKELAEFEDRLRSRFEWGLIADIQPPDLETKIAILQKRADSERVTIGADVANFIASNIRSNVRELEGALIRLVAYSSLTGIPINLHTAQEVLKRFISEQITGTSIDRIKQEVAEQFGLRVSELDQKTNLRHVVFPRQIAMYLAKRLTNRSMPDIGRYFGDKHHTTVLHSFEKIEENRKTDKDLDRLLTKLESRFN